MGYRKQTSIDKPQCPNGHGDMEFEKSWIVKGKGRKGSHEDTGFKVELFRCPTCRETRRIHEKLGE